MRQFKVVFQFEIMSYIKSKPYLISTAVLACLALLLGMLPTILSGFNFFGNDGSKNSDKDNSAPIGVYDARGAFDEDALNSALGIGAWVRLSSANPIEIEKAVASGEYSSVLAIDGLAYTVSMPGSGAMSFSGAAYRELVRQGYQISMLKDKGLSDSEIDTIVNAVPVASYVSVGKDAGQSYWLGFILLMALYMAILMYGQYVATSVVTEKTSKAVEILIVSANPVHLMFGKVIGAGLAGLAQLCTVMLVGTVSLSLSKNAWIAFAPSLSNMLEISVAGITLFYAMLFFLLGFFVFAFLYAAFASTVSRVEDVNTVSFFPILLFVAAFLVAISGMTQPTAAYIFVCSFIPFLSPMVMFMRICMTDVPFYQVLVSIAVNLITVAAVGVFSAKLYRVGVLMYGIKPTPKHIWRSFRRA